MKHTALNERLEDSVHETIEDIADELNLVVPYYPHVHLVGKGTRFESLRVHPKYLYSFKVAKSGQSIYDHPYIFLGCRHINHVSEESTHFLHSTNSGRSYRIRRLFQDSFSFDVLGEMIGFFGSKLINPSRSPTSSITLPFEELPEDPDEIKEFLRDRFGKASNLEIDPDAENLIHYEGYKLGERLFSEYISGRISLREIKGLIQNDFIGKEVAFMEFVRLRDKLN